MQLVDVPVYKPIEYSTILVDFRRRLEVMVSYAEQVGALPILILPPANDTGFEPNRSFLPRHAARGARSVWARVSRRTPAGGRRSLEQHGSIPGPAVASTWLRRAHYRLAKLLERTSLWDEAYSHYVAARDLDGYPMRCLNAFQQAFRDVAGRHRCVLIDGQSYFHAIGRHGLLDDELFKTRCIPRCEGRSRWPRQSCMLYASAGRSDGRRIRPTQSSIRPAPPRISASIAAPWKDISLSGRRFYSLVGRLRYETSERSRKIDEAVAAADKIAAGIAPERAGLVNIGIPAVPLIPAAAIKTDPKDSLFD